MQFVINIYNDFWAHEDTVTIRAKDLDAAEGQAQKAIARHAKAKNDSPQYYSWDFGQTTRVINGEAITLLSGKYYVMTRTGSGNATTAIIRPSGSDEIVWSKQMGLRAADALMKAFDLEGEEGITMRDW